MAKYIILSSFITNWQPWSEGREKRENQERRALPLFLHPDLPIFSSATFCPKTAVLRKQSKFVVKWESCFQQENQFCVNKPVLLWNGRSPRKGEEAKSGMEGSTPVPPSWSSNLLFSYFLPKTSCFETLPPFSHPSIAGTCRVFVCSLSLYLFSYRQAKLPTLLLCVCSLYSLPFTVWPMSVAFSLPFSCAFQPHSQHRQSALSLSLDPDIHSLSCKISLYW